MRESRAQTQVSNTNSAIVIKSDLLPSEPKSKRLLTHAHIDVYVLTRVYIELVLATGKRNTFTDVTLVVGRSCPASGGGKGSVGGV